MRSILALPFYVVGAIVYCICAFFLVLGDKLGATKYSRILIR